MAQNNLEVPFQLFLLLKLLYKSGKARLCKTAMKALSQLLGYNDQRQIKLHIKKLKELKWIHYNSQTGFYTINSYEVIRKRYQWKSRYSISCSLRDISNIYGVVGGGLYLYLHRVFWNKVNRDRVVREKGRTYHSLSRSLFPFDSRFAPVATTGINKLYGISQSKASRLKNATVEAGFIEVKKDLVELNINSAYFELLKVHNPEVRNLIKIKSRIYLQLIDLILPKRSLQKRQKLKT